MSNFNIPLKIKTFFGFVGRMKNGVKTKYSLFMVGLELFVHPAQI